MQFVINLFINGFAVFIASNLLRGVHVDSFFTAIAVSVVLGIVNMLLKPVLVILTLPINILSLGLFTFVINGLLIVLTSKFVSGFRVDGLIWAILFSLVLSLVNWFFNILTKR